MTEHEKELYKYYSVARDCITGSMIQLYTDLEMTNVEFYSKMDSDIEFRNTILSGMSDSRAQRLLELESSLITLALGPTVEEKRVTEDEDGISTTTVTKRYLPNLSALQVLLEKYQGSSWSITQKVQIDSGNDPKEVDYSLLTKAQLKQLAAGGNLPVKERIK